MAQAGNEKKVVLIDEGHSQYFNSTKLSKAIAAIEDTGKAIVHTTTKDLVDEVLAGVDLLIITNPGSNTQTVFSQIEKKAIAGWIKTGSKSLFLLCNPFDAADDNLRGNPVPLNDILASSYLQVSDTRFYEEAQTRSSNVIRNGTELEKPPSMLELLHPEVKNTKLQLINSSYEDSLSLLTKSSSVVADQHIVQTGFNTYTIGQKGIPNLLAENPCILGVSLLDKNSKVALSGSTLMFSDLAGPEDASWFDSQDNAILFSETINWLLNIIPVFRPTILEWAIAVPAAIGVIGIGAIMTGKILTRTSVPISAENIQETFTTETFSEGVEKITAAVGDGSLSKRQRKFAQRKTAVQQKNKKKRN